MRREESVTFKMPTQVLCILITLKVPFKRLRRRHTTTYFKNKRIKIKKVYMYSRSTNETNFEFEFVKIPKTVPSFEHRSFHFFNLLRGGRR